MNGQFCKVKGDYIKIIGDDNKEFIFLYKHNNFNKIVILDRNFLSTMDANKDCFSNFIVSI